jgi:hypothetical protein
MPELVVILSPNKKDLSSVDTKVDVLRRAARSVQQWKSALRQQELAVVFCPLRHHPNGANSLRVFLGAGYQYASLHDPLTQRVYCGIRAALFACLSRVNWRRRRDACMLPVARWRRWLTLLVYATR